MPEKLQFSHLITNQATPFVATLERGARHIIDLEEFCARAERRLLH